MKKFIFFSALFLLFCCRTLAQLEENNLKELKLKGKVKGLGELTYHAIEKDGAVEKEKMVEAFAIDFDESGNMTRKRYFQSDEVMYQKDTCLYDDGRMIEKDMYGRWGKFETKDTYKYNGDQKMVEMNSYDADGNFIRRAVYKYTIGRNSNWINVFFYDKNGGQKGSTSYQYDSLGNLTQHEMYTYKYDSNGNMIEKTYEGIGTSYQSSFQYEYDKNLNWIKRTEFIGRGEPYRIIERIIAYY
jgi:hypothetical protein